MIRLVVIALALLSASCSLGRDIAQGGIVTDADARFSAAIQTAQNFDPWTLRLLAAAYLVMPYFVGRALRLILTRWRRRGQD